MDHRHPVAADLDTVTPAVIASAPYFLHITDTHLFADEHSEIFGVHPDDSLRAGIDAVMALPRPPEFVVHTGDCSSDGSLASYARLRAQLARIGAPVHYVPGNHDDRDAMMRILNEGGARGGGAPHMSAVIDVAGLRVVMLDTSVPGSDGGHVGAGQRAWLSETLDASAGRDVIVALHHNPIPTGSRWLDAMTIADADEFRAEIARHASVRAVIFGHVHQEMDLRLDGIRYVATPATCFQFAPGSSEFALDGAAAGLRLVAMRAGELVTAVVRYGASTSARMMSSSAKR